MRDLPSGEAQQARQRRGRVARSSAQPAAHGNAFLAARCGRPPIISARAAERPAARQTRFSRVAAAASDALPATLEFDAWFPGAFQMQRVVQGERLEDGAQLVIAVGAAAQHIEAQIDLGKSRDADGWHAADQRVSAAGGFCCARWRFTAEIFCSSSATLSVLELGRQRAMPFGQRFFPFRRGHDRHGRSWRGYRPGG